MNKAFLFGPLFLFVILFGSCARQGSPSGGPRDETPPTLEKAIPENETVNFDKQQILLVFDEFIQLKNPASGILISPPLEGVEYKVKREQLTIILPDSLQENTTYKINFGESILDLNEGNILQNFSFVFATGPHLDSLSVKGIVVNALTGEPSENILVGLYSDLQDSTLFNSNPSYFAISSKDGSYEITNIREDSFYIAAFQDENKNFRYNPPYESLAFQDSTIYLDSNMTVSKLRISNEISVFPKLTCTPLGPSSILLSSDRYFISKEKLTVSPEPTYQISPSGDSTVYYFNDANEVAFTFINYQSDTFQYACDLDSSKPFTVFKTTQKKDRLIVQFNGLVDSVLSQPYYVKDSVNVSINVDSFSKHSIYLTLDTTGVNVTFPDSSVVSKNGLFLTSFSQHVRKTNQENTGKLSLVLKDSQLVSKPKILYLTTGKKVLHRYLPVGEQKITFEYLQPGNYTVKIALDENGNRTWDPALFSERKQPERIIEFTDQIEIKANWEQTLDLKMTN